MAVILVTGATSGIGRDAALRLARAGHRVLAGGRRPDALAELAAQGRVEPLALAWTCWSTTPATPCPGRSRR
jgi:NADP-dependent 3-hydroxy acid dehydrogenase YdfG